MSSRVANDLERYFVQLVNNERTKRGLDELQIERALNAAAEAHSEWMLEADRISHTGRSGSDIRERTGDAGYNAVPGETWVGETIGFSGNDRNGSLRDEARDILRTKMDSPSHRAAILREDAKHVGVGIETGDYRGEDYVVATLTFGDTTRPVRIDNGPINGGRGPDRLTGSDRADNMAGNGGNDVLRGLGGPDRLNGNNGNDVLRGGDGNDRLDGHADNDRLIGGKGADLVRGGDGHDTFIDDGTMGAAGRDTFIGGAHNDRIKASGGNDTGRGGDGHDHVTGGQGGDSLEGGRGHDTMAGNVGHDHIQGNGGDDRMQGNGGEDTIWGGDNEDRIHGGDDDDDIAGGHHNDRLEGGRGNDRIQGQGGHDDLQGDDGKDRLIGGRGHDRLEGENGRDVLTGSGGFDTFVFNEDDDRDRITDFNPAHDTLQLDPALWGGGRDAQGVIDAFAQVTGAGVMFDFGSDEILLQNLADTTGLAGAIDIA